MFDGEQRADADLGLDARLAAVTPCRARPILCIDLTNYDTLRNNSSLVKTIMKMEWKLPDNRDLPTLTQAKPTKISRAKKKVFRRFFFVKTISVGTIETCEDEEDKKAKQKH